MRKIISIRPLFLRTGGVGVGIVISGAGAFIVLKRLYSLFSPAGGADPFAPLAILFDRSVYGAVFIVGGTLLYTVVLPKLIARLLGPLPPPPPIRLTLNVTGIGAALIAALVTFGAVYLITMAAPNHAPSPYHGQMRDRLRIPVDAALITASLLLVTPVMEEFFYRGALFSFFARADRHLALLLQALLFGFAHYYFVAPVMAFAGLVFGIVSMRFGLSASMISHSLYNALILIAEMELTE